MNKITKEIDKIVTRQYIIHKEISDNVLEFVELYTDSIDDAVNLNFLTWTIESGEIE